MAKKKKKKKNPYLTVRNTWTRKPLTHIKESDKLYNRQKAKKDTREEID